MSASASSSSHLGIDPTAFVADKASLNTSSHHPHPIIIGANCVVHPFARLDSSSGPISLGEQCVVWEKASIGGSGNTFRQSSLSAYDAAQMAAVSTTDDGDESEDQRLRFKTITLEYGTIVHPHAKIAGPATIGSSCIIGVGAEIGAGAVLGQGVTVASGTRIEDGTIIEKGSIVFGGGLVRRPGKGVSNAVHDDLQRTHDLKQEGEHKHRALLAKLVKGTVGGSRFT